MTTPISVADQIGVLQAASATRLPAEVLEVFQSDTVALDEAGIPAGVATPGTQMPDGDLLDSSGEPTSLEATRGGKPAVVVFYRGAWCPYCNLTLKAYQEQLLGSLTARGVALIAVSPQRPDGSLSMRETNALTFDVLSDPGNQLATGLGILTSPGEGTAAAQGKLGLDVAATNADGTNTLPMPTVVVVNAGGTIRWIDVHPNYTTRTEPGEILAAVDALS